MSNNLDLLQMVPAQSNKEATANTQSGQLDAAITELLVLAVDDTNAVTVTADQHRLNLVLQFDDDVSPPTALVTVTMPAVQRGLFIVFNNMTFPLELGIAAQPDAFPKVDVGEERLLQSDGVNVKEVPAGLGSFRGALVNINALQAIVTATATAVAWDVEAYDRKKGSNQFWLGPNAVVTAAVDDNVTLAAHAMETGDGPFQFTTTGVLPAGLALLTNYWAIKTAVTTFKVATSLALAKAGTAVDITGVGTGVHTIDRDKRLVVPDGVTRVKLESNMEFATNATGYRFMKNQKNGADVLGGGASLGDGRSDFPVHGHVSSAVLEVVAGDYFELVVEQTSGGNLNLSNATNHTWFSIEEA